jgi:hypothetical protein
MLNIVMLSVVVPVLLLSGFFANVNEPSVRAKFPLWLSRKKLLDLIKKNLNGSSFLVFSFLNFSKAA